ncbi:beta-1,3-galactosyltransferase 1-like isoform X2 [Zootermopsis nevadensis]|uniref:beta-1,3-galactosyltransferase 1-like isoform X2 n=1 Tax=Zootermopsis nevadensis TaxID=136037 RepID=UPI000B8E2A92|nr:beta-1,3-galactosyltransferase 1-like isoform X2 [Zootermopsis nevadensis]
MLNYERVINVCKETVRKQVKVQNMDMPASDRKMLLDIDDFRFHMNQPSCQGTPVMVTLVHSAPKNRDKRVLIRNTWGSIIQGSLLFLLGEVDSPLLQVSLESENDRYHDLLQGNFRDAYRNMTYKHVMGFKWVLHSCPGVRYVLKSDDDTFVNTPVLIRALTQGRPRCGMKKLIMCRVWSGVPVKRIGDKWTVTREEFHDDIYPDYCSGTAILYSQDMVYALYKKAQRTRYFWVDDVHVTGTLAKNLNLTHQPVVPVTLGIKVMVNNTIRCDYRQVKGAPPWIQSFLFSRHNLSNIDMGLLWWYVKKCASIITE